VLQELRGAAAQRDFGSRDVSRRTSAAGTSLELLAQGRSLQTRDLKQKALLRWVVPTEG